MHWRYLLLTALVLFPAAPSSLAAGESPPAPAYTENGFDPRMLDATVSKPERVKLFAHVIALANHGQVRAQDLAGTMYWQGPKIAGSPMPVNLGQARVLLANAAVRGDVLAMAKLAELELAAGRTTPAMVWAQLYARYLHPLKPLGGAYTGYAASLIRRIAKAGGTTGKAVHDGVASVIRRHDQGIRRGIDALEFQKDHGRTFLVQPAAPPGLDPTRLAKVSGVAEYMAGFDTRGKPIGIWPLDAFPDPALGADLRDDLEHIYANAARKGSGMRYLRISITHQPVRFRRLHTTN